MRVADETAAGRRVLQGYDADWPASVIHHCEQPVILTDRAAMGAL